MTTIATGAQLIDLPSLLVVAALTVGLPAPAATHHRLLVELVANGSSPDLLDQVDGVLEQTASILRRPIRMRASLSYKVFAVSNSPWSRPTVSPVDGRDVSVTVWGTEQWSMADVDRDQAIVRDGESAQSVHLRTCRLSRMPRIIDTMEGALLLSARASRTIRERQRLNEIDAKLTQIQLAFARDVPALLQSQIAQQAMRRSFERISMQVQADRM